MINPYLLLALIVAWAGSLAATGWTAFGMGEDKCIAAGSKAEKIAQEAFDNGQKGAAAAIAQNAPVQTTIYQRATHEIKTNTVYVDCKHSPAVMLDINQALTGKRPQPAGDSKLPAVVAPGR